jgi:polyhydroxybutyrate depolymerase
MRISALILLCLIALAACRDRGATEEPTEAPSASPAPAPTATQAPEATAAATLEPEPPAVLEYEAGIAQITLEAGGRKRTARLYAPDGLTGPAPLVIGLHGGVGSGEQFAKSTRFDELAGEAGFIAAYPDGTGAAKTWNGGRCCGYAVRNAVDDVTFVAALIDAVAARYPVDLSRVYAVGHSNGGIMALRLACELADQVAAAGAVAGSLEVPGCSPARPVPVLLIHGDADESHPLEGGLGPKSISDVGFTSVAASLELIKPAMGCPGNAAGYDEYGLVETTEWLCAEGTKVMLQVINGGPHGWPGGRGVGSDPDSPLDATQALWEFVSGYQID